ncbi:toll-like receptor 4 [Mytilus trossulus]|uniref:toll-like receptor 4 n=1 Tax=Mytilus trossulus TaxID=6551 RepID=UPI0030046B4D
MKSILEVLILWISCKITTCTNNLPYFHQCLFDLRCQCRNDKEFVYVDCASQELKDIPHLPFNVKTLNLSNNSIQFIKDYSFDNLANLTDLDLTGNKLQTKTVERCAFEGLNQLKRLTIANNDIAVMYLPEGIFKPLVSLMYLNVKHNAFPEKSQGKIIGDLRTLETLEIDIREPYVGSLFGKGVSFMKSLKRLVSGLCTVYMLASMSFMHTEQLEHVDISSCPISIVIRDTFSNMHSLKFVKVHFRKLLYSAQVDNIIRDLQTTPIDTLILERTFFTAVIFPYDVFSYLNKTNIRSLHITNNMLTTSYTSSSFEYLPPSLRHLDFSSDRLRQLSIYMPYLLRLNLRNNSLGTFLAGHSYMLSAKTDLQSIDLSMNNIHYLTFSMFHNNVRLEVINLSHNHLIDITFDTSHLLSIKILDLSDNSITHFNETIINAITTLFKATYLKIDLTNNMLQCSCNTVKFLRWVLDHNNRFLNKERYMCKLENGNIANLTSLKETVNQIKKECSSYSTLIVCVSVGIFAAILILCSGLIYRHRWTLRYMYYTTKSKYYRYKPVEMDEMYSFNAFVSYSDKEKDFIINEWIPNIEQACDMKLCIHQRDFLPGEDITANITNAIRESKKTVCIVTQSFLDSYYCIFEFNMARIESIYSRGGRSTTFLVFYENIQPKDLPLVMLELVHQQSYIEYHHDQQGNVVFWEKIKEVIK